MKGVWIAQLIVGLLLGIVGWFIRGNFEEQKLFNKQVDARLIAIELEQARAAASRFTMAEWISARTVIDTALANQDKRITRTEDAIILLKETLPRMEKKLDEIRRTP